jgi:hypothetical protein
VTTLWAGWCVATQSWRANGAYKAEAVASLDHAQMYSTWQAVRDDDLGKYTPVPVDAVRAHERRVRTATLTEVIAQVVEYAEGLNR